MAEMLDPNSLQPLTYAGPKTAYAASSGVTGKALLTIVGGGLLLAALVGVLLTTLILAGVSLPDFVVCFAPGVIVGLGVSWLIRRAKVHHKMVAMLLAAVCGAFAIAVVVASLYVVAVMNFSAELRDYLVRQNWTPNAIEAAIASPFVNFDQMVLVPSQGRGGLIGFAASLSGEARAFLIVAAIASIGLAVFAVRSTSLKAPFCELCRDYFAGPVTLAVLPFGWERDVVHAIEANDVKRMRDMRRASYGEDFGVGCASVLRYRCATCQETLLEVSVFNGSESVYKNSLLASAEMLEALKPPSQNEPTELERASGTLPVVDSNGSSFEISDAKADGGKPPGLAEMDRLA